MHGLLWGVEKIFKTKASHYMVIVCAQSHGRCRGSSRSISCHGFLDGAFLSLVFEELNMMAEFSPRIHIYIGLCLGAVGWRWKALRQAAAGLTVNRDIAASKVR